MTEGRTYRLRDPVHGLIVFQADDPVDQLAWALLNTPEFQRLRRIKQLGVSEFVFPGATHTRFAHCIGVFHTARQLIEIINRELKHKGQEPNGNRETVAVLAALLHDIGHGPFSHAFEHAYDMVRHQRNPDAPDKSHEEWTAEIIINASGSIRPLLESYKPGLTEDIARLLNSKHPEDIYHAVVSSSFDADRLDYLRRDRLMTGSGAGALDYDWLLDNLAVEDIDSAAGEDEDTGMTTPSFCLRERALQAAEAFVLARWHLYCQVYFHKTTRCVEAMIQDLLSRFAELVDQGKLTETGVSKGNALSKFFAKRGDTLEGYHSLDDAVVWAAFGQMRKAKDSVLADLSSRLLDRKLFRVLDFDSGINSDDDQVRLVARKVRALAKENPHDILEDGPKIAAYGEVRADDASAHKRIMIVGNNGRLSEITKRSPVVKAIEPRTFLRFFFRTDEMRQKFIGQGA